MKAICLLLIAFGLVGVLFAAQAERNEVLWWEEDFESSALGWTHYCEPANMWKSVTYYLPFGGIRQYWIMGDGIGYTDHQYLVLDTPERILTDSTAILNFSFSCSIQPTPGASPPYNGWDAFNVRASVDGGTNWTTISGSPEYNISSSYAFGEEFGEGPGVPGWGGNYDMQTATFDLSEYVGMAVKIRFAFASDYSISSENYYVILNNISFGGYNNYGVDDGLMIPRNLGPASEDIWHLATDITAPSPTHIFKCQNAAGTYNRCIEDYLVSPPIELPVEGSIRADFMVRGGLDDDWYGDSFGWEICGSDGIWQGLSSSSGLLYNPPNAWQSTQAYYPGIDFSSIMNSYMGQTVRFRWYLRSDNDSPSGEGLLLDDFQLWHYLQLAPPHSLVASVNGTNVTLTWLAPANQAYPISNYRVFRDDVELALIPGSALTYTDANVPVGLHSYCVVIMSGIYASEASNTAWAYITGDTQAELAHDDGTAESAFHVGSGHQMAVKFNHTGAISLRYAKVYVQTPGTQGLILRVMDNDGPEDSPGTQLGQSYCLSCSLYEGWNYLPLPAGIVVSDGQFYLDIMESPSANLIGLDDSSNGDSFVYNGTVWEAVRGKLMIRAIVEPTVANDDSLIPPLALDCSNYPNPFNPETSIAYSLPQSGPCCLKIFNLKGQLVRVLADGFQEAGRYSVVWNGEDEGGKRVCSGVYFSCLSKDGQTVTHKMLLAK